MKTSGKFSEAAQESDGHTDTDCNQKDPLEGVEGSLGIAFPMTSSTICHVGPRVLIAQRFYFDDALDATD